jgi:hypothetical protein
MAPCHCDPWPQQYENHLCSESKQIKIKSPPTHPRYNLVTGLQCLNNCLDITGCHTTAVRPSPKRHHRGVQYTTSRPMGSHPTADPLREETMRAPSTTTKLHSAAPLLAAREEGEGGVGRASAAVALGFPCHPGGDERNTRILCLTY